MTLLLSVADLQREAGESYGFNLTGDASSLDFPEGVVFGPIGVEGRALWTGDTVIVEGQVRTEATLTCGRCLETYKLPLAALLTREFRPVEEGSAQGGPGGDGPDGRRKRRIRRRAETASAPPRLDTRDKDEDMAEREQPLPFSRQIIDLAFPAYEALVLELPMKPVCREQCPGLCPDCGTVQGERTCGCQAEKADPRFLSLKRLLEAKERGE